MSKQKKYHYIYKTTCKITGKFYVGMHSTDNLEDGYLGSGKILGYSRKKYGDENHIKEVVEYCVSRDELKRREKEIVNEDLLKDPLNINLKYGGDGGGGFWSDQQRINFHKAGWEAMMHKRDHSAASKLVWSRHREKMLAAILEPQKKATLAAQSENAKNKRNATLKMIKHQQGNKNSNYGKRTVNKAGEVLKIDKSELSSFLMAGYELGSKSKNKNPSLRQISIEKYKQIDQKCKNSKCDNELTYKQWIKGIQCCSKSCSNRIRFLK